MRVIIAVDASTDFQPLLDEIVLRTWPPDTEVRLITVELPLPPPTWETSRDEQGVLDRMVKQQREESAIRLQAAAAMLRSKWPSVDVKPERLEGRPKEAILQLADQWSADLIMVGSHEYGMLHRFFLGSVSHAVAFGARCSVEIVRPRSERMSETPEQE